MSGYSFCYQWEVPSSHTPRKLWSLLSNTRRLWRDLGFSAGMQRNDDISLPAGYRKKESGSVFSGSNWIEEPVCWHAPGFLSLRRHYNRGTYKTISLRLDVSESKSRNGASVIMCVSGKTSSRITRLAAALHIKTVVKPGFRKLMNLYEQALSQKTLPASIRKPLRMKAHRELSVSGIQLAEATGNEKLSEKLIHLLTHADPIHLTHLTAHQLSHMWQAPVSQTLQVLLQAGRMNLIRPKWLVRCPDCSGTVASCNELPDIKQRFLCSECKEDFATDFHQSVHLAFGTHQKAAAKQNSPANPVLPTRTFFNLSLKPGQIKRVKMSFPKGHYQIFDDKNGQEFTLVVRNDGPKHASLAFCDRNTKSRTVEVARECELSLLNQTDRKLWLCCHDSQWEHHAITASEVTSLSTFRNLYPDELLLPQQKVSARDLTILFTDLSNSSDLYTQDGEDSAVGTVMNHFEIMEKIILMERGAIVKTIGDAVMAIFPKPIYAVRAFEQAQHVFMNELPDTRPIHIKGGIHRGDSVAVSLNDRIDYFGNTINIASRLVEMAEANELIISEDAFNCAQIRDYMSDRDDDFRIEHYNLSLKGFKGQYFKAKRLALNYPSLRLVV
jgi:class 3 adenylate cyclase